MGVLSFMIGLVMTIWLLVGKLLAIASHETYRDVTNNPLFYIALIAIVIGFQLFLTGFLAELVSRNSPERNVYQIEKEV